MPKQEGKRSAPERRGTEQRKGAKSKKKPDESVAATEVDSEKYAAMAREFVLDAWPEIVQGLIKKAAEGGYQQTKLLLEVCRLTEADNSNATEERQQQLCDVLLEGLKLFSGPEEESGAAVSEVPEQQTDEKN